MGNSLAARRVLLGLVASIATVGLFQGLFNGDPRVNAILADDCDPGYAPEQGDYSQCVAVPGEQAEQDASPPTQDGGVFLSESGAQSYGSDNDDGSAAIAACEDNDLEEAELSEVNIICPNA